MMPKNLTGLATTATLPAIENKIPNLSDLIKKKQIKTQKQKTLGILLLYIFLFRMRERGVGVRGWGKKAPYQLFPSKFYKRKNYLPKISEF